MVEPNKQLARTKQSHIDKREDEFELLLTRKPASRKPVGSSARARFVYNTSLLVIGLVFTISCLWAMLYTSDSEEVVKNLGMHRVANSLENILSLLAYPVLMFSVILTLYAAQQLYRLYKEVTTVTSARLRRSK